MRVARAAQSPAIETSVITIGPVATTVKSIGPPEVTTTAVARSTAGSNDSENW